MDANGNPNANNPGAAAAAVLYGRRHTRVSLAGIFTRRDYIQEDSVVRGVMSVPISSNYSIKLHLPQDNAEMLSLVTTCLTSIATEEDSYQIGAYYCSVLACYFPGMIDVIKESFTEIGFNVILITTRLQRDQIAFNMQDEYPADESLVFFGQCVLLLYKDVQDVGYFYNFMRQTTNALRGHAVVPHDRVFRICVSFEKARVIKTSLGGCHPLKKQLLKNLMASSQQGSQRLSVVCNYLVDVLAWVEMSSITLIYDTILLTRSPILKEACVYAEVRNFIAALKVIAASENQPYFRILNPPYITSIMNRSKFPTLLTVARELKKKSHTTTAAQFASNTVPAHILRLVNLHKAYMNGRRITSANTLCGYE